MRTWIAVVAIVAVVAVASPSGGQPGSSDRLTDAVGAAVRQSSVVHLMLREAMPRHPDLEPRLAAVSVVDDAVDVLAKARLADSDLMTNQFGRYALASLVESHARVIAWASVSLAVMEMASGAEEPAAFRWAVETLASAEVVRMAMQAEVDDRRLRRGLERAR